MDDELLGQTVVVIGGSAGIGLETARRARAEGADVILSVAIPSASSDAAQRARRASASRPSTPRTSNGSDRSSTRRCRRSTTCWSPAPARTTRRSPSSTSTGRVVTSRPISCCRSRSRSSPRPGCVPAGTLLFMGGTGGRRAGAGLGADLGADRRAAGADPQPRARGRTGPGEPDRRRLRRHTAVGVAPRRRARRSAASSSARRCRSAASSDRPTSPRSPSTS